MALYFIANTATRILLRIFTKQTQLNPYAASFALTMPTYILMLVYSLHQYDSFLNGLNILIVVLLLLQATFMTYFGKISVVAQKHVDTASFMVLRQISVPVSVVASSLFIGESLTAIQSVGMVLILIGAYVIASNGRTIPVRHIGKHEALVLIYGVFLGLSLVFSRYVQELTSLSTLLVVGSGLETLISAGKAYTENRATAHKNIIVRKDLGLALAIGLLSAVHIVTFFSAAELIDNVSVVSTLSSFRIVTIFLASYFFLKERDSLKIKLLGSGLALIGVVLV